MRTEAEPNVDDYSATTTLIHFPNPLPLLRHPVKSNPPILSYKTQHHWAQSYLSTKSHLISQCQSGARFACSISASNKCKQTWWDIIVGKPIDFKERVRCEEAVMNECFDLAKDKCVVFAKNKCVPAFKGAWIGDGDVRGVDLVGDGEDIDGCLTRLGLD